MKWEYKYVLATNDMEYLNDLGNQEWELICSFRDTGENLYYIFKRPILDKLTKNVFGEGIRKGIEGYFGGKVG